jgi:N-acetylglutamate synthase
VPDGPRDGGPNAGAVPALVAAPPPPGATVTVRIHTPVGDYTIVGVLLAATPEGWTLRRRDGSLADIDPATIVAGRLVPPGPAQRVTVVELERIAADGWRARETDVLGGWLLRAAGGFTGRANSALPLGDPGRPLGEALDTARGWYADRGLPARVQTVPGLVPALDAELDRRGWMSGLLVHVEVAELSHPLRAVTIDPSLDLTVSTTLTDDWLAAYRADTQPLPAAARDVLAGHPRVGFATVRDGGTVLAIARAAVDGRWAGLGAVEVTPAARGRGLAEQVSAAALRWAGQQGARRSYLQVTAANAVAQRVYERLGYVRHHGYVYRDAP